MENNYQNASQQNANWQQGSVSNFNSFNRRPSLDSSFGGSGNLDNFENDEDFVSQMQPRSSTFSGFGAYKRPNVQSYGNRGGGTLQQMGYTSYDSLSSRYGRLNIDNKYVLHH
uniref:Uncharacterized protein n=1 Tax=Rhabditophanes sp. KR3021 TaxID=114890 RepID=A0AC35TFP7_9BILA